jgi:phosphohistidine phosphatase
VRKNELPRTLLVMRHAKSSRDSRAASDHDRPLAPRGRREAPLVGRWLRDENLVPDIAICSTALRARETAALALGDEVDVRLEERAYGADLDDWLALLATVPDDAETAMVVGHNPALDDLVDHLAGGAPPGPDGKLMVTAAVAVLEMPERWTRLRRGAARLAALRRPRAAD